MHGTNAGDHLVHARRLGDVAVRAEFKVDCEQAPIQDFAGIRPAALIACRKAPQGWDPGSALIYKPDLPRNAEFANGIRYYQTPNCKDARAAKAAEQPNSRRQSWV